jgi:hypothetical protein
MGRRIQICFDCADAERLASFWAEALDYDVAEPPSGFNTWSDFSVAESQSGERWCQIIDPAGRGPTVLFHTVPEPKEVKNRLHLDVFASDGDIEAAIAQLRILGATHLRTDHDGGFAVMQDPEGNEFCVA